MRVLYINSNVVVLLINSSIMIVPYNNEVSSAVPLFHSSAIIPCKCKSSRGFDIHVRLISVHIFKEVIFLILCIIMAMFHYCSALLAMFRVLHVVPYLIRSVVRMFRVFGNLLSAVV